MPLQIIRGKRQGAIRAVIYGTEGIGKSTLAAQIPDALLIDTEDGTGQIDAARVIALDWRAIEHATKELIADTQGFRAVVIDTADWLEKALIEHVLRQAGKKSIEDFGYGKGYTIIQEHVVRYLALLDQLIAKGVHVIFVAHAKVVRTSPPDQTDGFDRYELKLTRQVAPLLKEWADLVLFCNYRVQIVEGSDGRLKAQGGKERIMHAVHSAAWDAKNRFGLPDELPMQFEKIAHLFSSAAPRAPEPAGDMPSPAEFAEWCVKKYGKAIAPNASREEWADKLREFKAASAQAAASIEAAVVADPTPVQHATADQVARIKAQASKPGAAAVIEEALAYCEAIDLEELEQGVADKLVAKLQAMPAQPASVGYVFPPAVRAWFEENDAATNAYLRHVAWLKNGQTWRDLDAERGNSVVDRFDKFKAAALSHAKTSRKAA